MSNRTPKRADAATESVPRRKLAFGLLLVAFGLLAILQGVRGMTDDKIKLLTPKAVLNVELAVTTEAKQQGLSGRLALGKEEGMLFVFDSNSQQHCFWMKDMNFAIDMIWLDENKKVVTMKSHVTPETYPQTFCPDSSARYVLEVASDKASEYGIELDTVVKF